MEKSDMAVLLSLLSAADGRHVNQITIETWHEVAGHLEFADAREAVMDHVATSSKYMTLAEMIAGAADAAERRTQRLAIADTSADDMFDRWCRVNGTTEAEYRAHAAHGDLDWIEAVHQHDRDRRIAAGL